jgi:hypothetical protein
MASFSLPHVCSKGFLGTVEVGLRVVVAIVVVISTVELSAPISPNKSPIRWNQQMTGRVYSIDRVGYVRRGSFTYMALLALNGRKSGILYII